MPVADDQGPCWESVAAESRLAEAVWEDGSVVYNLADGSLTALSITATETLRHLRSGAAVNTAVLAEKLLGCAAEPEELQQLEAILEQLQSLGLVRNPSV